VLLNLARLDQIDRELLQELDDLVSRCLATLDMQGTSVEGKRQVADILNRLPAERQDMIELLRAHDPAMLAEIELSMYDFFILSRQGDAVLGRIIEEVPLALWAVALKGAEPAVRDAILTSMPRRQAQNFDDMIRRAGPVPLSRIEQTRRDIMAIVKGLAESGQIALQLYPEAVVE